MVVFAPMPSAVAEIAPEDLDLRFPGSGANVVLYRICAAHFHS